MKKSIWLLMACTLLAASAAAQNKCTFQTTHARYATTCQGFVSTAAGAPWLHSHCWGPVRAMRMVFSSVPEPELRRYRSPGGR